MKTLLNLSILTYLLAAAAGTSFAEMTIEHASRERAKELGMEIRSKPAGPEGARVELELKREGELRGFSRVDLEVRDGKKLLLSSSLREQPSKPGHILVTFTADRANLDKITLRVVVSEQAPGGSGHELRVKDFVELEKAK